MTEEELKEIQELRDTISENLSGILDEIENTDTASIYMYASSLKDDIQRLQEIGGMNDPDIVSDFNRFAERLDRIDKEIDDLYDEFNGYSENFDETFKNN